MFGEYSREEGEKLLRLARESIEEEFTREKPEMPEGKQFKQARGVFVTLTKNRKLRGCIGIPYPELGISQAVYSAAKSSAFSDPRFSAVTQSEMEDIKIEISILTIPEDASSIDKIKVGKDGLMCNYLGYQGLLLPQVALEYKMNRIQFLEALCNKAGLPKDNWQNKNFKIKKFSCQIFKEE